MDVIEPARVEWASPIALVPKRNAVLYSCVYFCKLRAVTTLNSYAIRCTDECIDSLLDQQNGRHWTMRAGKRTSTQPSENGKTPLLRLITACSDFLTCHSGWRIAKGILTSTTSTTNKRQVETGPCLFSRYCHFLPTNIFTTFNKTWRYCSIAVSNWFQKNANNLQFASFFWPCHLQWAPLCFDLSN